MSSLPSLSSVLSSAPFVWSVLFLLVVSLPGICLLYFHFFGVLPLRPCPLALSLRDLPWWVLFLLSLSTAHRVGDLQALSSQVSSSGDALFLSFLPAFRAKTVSSVHPLPRSFPVQSLWVFVGSLPDELLLCPVRALRLYLSRTASLPSRPRSLFVSPRSPSRSLSQVALSFFICAVIAEVYSSAGRSLPSAPSSSSYSSSPRSSLHANGVHGVAASGVFLCDAPLAPSLRLFLSILLQSFLPSSFPLFRSLRHMFMLSVL